MVKIGLTRRLEPLDRINELGDASVPFRYDVHALFFSEDAVTLENQLHQFFSERRVNWANMRREFFFATPAEVQIVLGEKVGNLLEFTTEYMQSIRYWPDFVRETGSRETRPSEPLLSAPATPLESASPRSPASPAPAPALRR